MSEKILLHARQVDTLVDLSNCDREFLGYFLAERTPAGLRTLEYVFTEGAENDAAPIQEEDLDFFRIYVAGYVKATRKNPTLALIGSHIHSRTFGDMIRQNDPYWSVDGRNHPFPLNGIVDGQFYMSSRDGNETAFARNHDLMQIDHHLFVHPAWGYEGQTMVRDLVRITAFAYDETALGNVKKIPLEVIVP